MMVTGSQNQGTLLYARNEDASDISYLADIPSNTLLATWVSSSVPQLGAAMLADAEEFVVGVEAEATRVEEGIFFFGPGFFLATFGKPVVVFLGCRGAFGLGGTKLVAAGGATAHGALGPRRGAAPGMPMGGMAGDPSMEGMPMGDAASHPSMGTMPMAATWERSGQRTGPVTSMGGGGLH